MYLKTRSRDCTDGMLTLLNRKMRPLKYGAEVGSGNLMEKRSMDLEHVKEAWDEWEIHCLILLSLSLQVFLSLMADLRKSSASRVLSNVMWLAYMSADTVAVFVLGHLAVHAQGPRHELMLFWAPFVLVHLGGQDTITAFSKQDNELWMRHLLGLVTQTVVAAYVVSKSSWPDARLRAAMVLMFFCGFLKYAGRTCCLYLSSPKNLWAKTMVSLSRQLSYLQDVQGKATSDDDDAEAWRFDGRNWRFEVMFLADRYWEFVNKEFYPDSSVDDIMLVDTPVDDVTLTVVADQIPSMMKDYKDRSRTDRCIAYQYAASCLVKSYQVLYTKTQFFLTLLIPLEFFMHECHLRHAFLLVILLILTYILFPCILTAIALVLFASAQKEGHHSKPDITVSYILLVGAIVLDLLPTFTFILSIVRKPFRPRTVVDWAVMITNRCFLRGGWHTRKQWSEELAQYNMTRRYSTSVEEYKRCSMPSIRKWIITYKPLGAWCAEIFDLKRTPVTDDLQLFVLDRLLLLQTMREEWNFASFRGERALGKWMDSHQVPEPERSSYALHKSISTVDFPASVLIWHIATEICYFTEDNGRDIENDETRTTTKMKNRSRELSQYIMYLIFKCDVMLTSKSRLMHNITHEELTDVFRHVHVNEKKTVIVMFEAMRKETREDEAMKKEEEQQCSMQGMSQDRKTNNEAPGNKDAAATSSGSRRKEHLQRTVEALCSPVLPLARDLAQELIGIHDEAHRWEFISDVWLEMLFYTAPRCGAGFHYEHLSTGGEFITHILFLMRSLGPFMPKPGA